MLRRLDVLQIFALGGEILEKTLVTSARGQLVQNSDVAIGRSGISPLEPFEPRVDDVLDRKSVV